VDAAQLDVADITGREQLPMDRDRRNRGVHRRGIEGRSDDGAEVVVICQILSLNILEYHYMI
jgi:hypothetical protein